MIINPWLSLSWKSPYILPEDYSAIKDHKHFSNLRLDVSPDPFVGNFQKAKVIFLALNPGFDETDRTLNMKDEKFLHLSRKNLNQENDSDFYYFLHDLEYSGGYIWWTRKLKPLMKSGVSLFELKESIMSIELFPYHSVQYKHINIELPSQSYTFELVKKAVVENKIIVVMRGERYWLKNVPELEDYPYIKLNSPQNVTISPKNTGEKNFKRILYALKS